MVSSLVVSFLYTLNEIVVIATQKGKASNRDALSVHICVYICMYVCMYVCLFHIGRTDH